jgi:hypothetical protein
VLLRFTVVDGPDKKRLRSTANFPILDLEQAELPLNRAASQWNIELEKLELRAHGAKSI